MASGSGTPTRQYTTIQRSAFAGRHNPYVIVLSIALSVLIWSYFSSRNTETSEVDVRLEITIPEGWDIEGARPPETVKVVVRGPQQAIQSLQSENILLAHRFPALDAASSEVQVPIKFTPEKVLYLPPDVSVQLIEPGQIDITLVRLITRMINVDLQLSGKPDPGFDIGSRTTKPQAVQVRMPEKYYSPNLVVKTLPLDITGQRRQFSRWIDLQPLEISGQTFAPLTPWVEADVTITDQLVTEQLDNQPVRILLSNPEFDPRRWQLEPPQVNVEVKVRSDRTEDLTGANLTVYVDTRDMSAIGEQEYVLNCNEISPNWLTVVKIEPKSVRLIPKQ